jgi:hypothetical protein
MDGSFKKVVALRVDSFLGDKPHYVRLFYGLLRLMSSSSSLGKLSSSNTVICPELALPLPFCSNSTQ